MTFIASVLFLFAIAVCGFSLFVSISENMPRILNVIEERGGSVETERTIRIGALRSLSNGPAAARARTKPSLVYQASAPTALRPETYELPLAA
jgi:hypothetical protein